MTKIALVVSDLDGTLLTKEKLLTERAIGAVRKLHEAGIGFTITSSRPPPFLLTTITRNTRSTNSASVSLLC